MIEFRKKIKHMNETDSIDTVRLMVRTFRGKIEKNSDKENI